MSDGATTTDVALLLPLLLDQRTPCAPHVVSRLRAELGDHRTALLETAGLLTKAQRQGLAALPSPLPAGPDVRRAFAALDLGPRDRELLFAAAVALSDDLEPLLDFDGRTPTEIADSSLGELLLLRAGRIRFTDPRAAIGVVATMTPVQAVAVHARLRAVFERRGSRVEAAWHGARASLARNTAVAQPLVRAARDLATAGRPEQALLLAREAVGHADGARLDEARQAAGTAALGGGYAGDAAEWLGGVFSEGSERRRLEALPGLLVALAHLHDGVPAVDPARLRPRRHAPRPWQALARAAAVAGPLCAERGDRRGMRVWLDLLHEASQRGRADPSLRDASVALSWTLLGETDTGPAEGIRPEVGALLRSLRHAVAGRLDEAVDVLAQDGMLGTGSDPVIAGFEGTPLIEAYRAVAHALFLLWRGEAATAREHLFAAALTLPVALPFAGLGVVLARRLDLAVTGRVGPLAESLTAALPSPRRIDLLLDRSIERFLAGDYAAAAESSRLWREIGFPGPTLSVPGLEEVNAPGEEEAGLRRVETPEIARARSLHARVATVPEARWATERREILAEACTLSSAFLRGRVEAMIGMRCAIFDERVEAGEHLRTSVRLFEVAGARAWAEMVERRAARLHRVGHASGGDPLATCRAAWAQHLTARELDVATRAAAGAANRDIARTLAISVRTVEVHLGRAFSKLGVRTRVELTVRAHRVDHLL